MGLTERHREALLLLVALWTSALAGVMMLLGSRVRRRDPLCFLPALIGCCHFAVLVVIGNFTYRYRLLYPMYLMCVPYSAHALSTAARVFAGTRER